MCVICVRVHYYEAARYQPTTFHGVCLIFSSKDIIVEAWMSPVMVVLCGMNSESRTLSESQVISVAFCSVRKTSNKFRSEALISASGTFTCKCRKCATRDLRLYFPSEGSHTQDFYALKKSIVPGWVSIREPWFQWQI